MVHLSAPILTRSIISAFTGSIEVDITAEDLSNDDPQQNAEFGRHYLHCISIQKFVDLIVREQNTYTSHQYQYLPLPYNLQLPQAFTSVNMIRLKECNKWFICQQLS